MNRAPVNDEKTDANRSGGLFCPGAAAAAVFALVNPERVPWQRTESPRRPAADHETRPSVETRDHAGLPRQPAPPALLDIILDKFEHGGYETAVRFAAPLHDAGSLQELRESVRGRARRGIRALKRKYEQIHVASQPPGDRLLESVSLQQSIGFLYYVRGQVPGGRHMARAGAGRKQG